MNLWKQERHGVRLGLAMGLAIAGAWAESARAADKAWDFTNDPSGELTIAGNNDQPWRNEGGNPGGFLALTYPQNSQYAAIVFPNLDPGKIVTGFTLSADLRIGNPTGDRTADGFSVSFARDGDPVLADPSTDGGFAGRCCAETGTRTGIAVLFDTWSGNTFPNDPADTTDIEGIIVRVDDVTVKKVGLWGRNGACDDINSLQTGPRTPEYWANGGDPRDPASWSGLCWKPFAINLTTDGKLTVSWKGNLLLDGFQTDYFPTAGQVVLAGRTGGANENVHVDNLKLTTIARTVTAIPGAVSNLKAAEAGANRVLLTWDKAVVAGDANAKVAYDVLRDGTVVAQTLTTLTFEDRGVNPGKSYSYVVRGKNIAGTAGPDKSISVTTAGLVDAFAFLQAKIWNGIGGTAVDALLSDPHYQDPPDSTRYVNGFSFGETSGFGNTYGDNFGVVIQGTFTAPETGSYKFFVRSDDASQLFINMAGGTAPDPTASTPIANEDGCCKGFLEDAPYASEPIALTAGKQYGLTFVVKEGGGGDWGQVAVRKEGDTTPAGSLSPIRGAILAGKGDAVGASISFTQQPANQTVAANSPTELNVEATGSSPFGADYGKTVVYQWYVNNLPILGANGPRLGISVTPKSHDQAKIKVVASVAGASATSAEAVLTVLDDTTPPKVAAVVGADTFDSITFSFSEPVQDSSALNVTNYKVLGLGLSNPRRINDRTIRFDTTRQMVHTRYSVRVGGVLDNAGLAVDFVGSFVSFKFQPGAVQFSTWNNETSGFDPAVPASKPPTQTRVVDRFYSGANLFDNYYGQLKALFTAPRSGDYVFWMSSDDHGELYLSSDENPTNKKRIAEEPVWSDSMYWKTDGGSNSSTRGVDGQTANRSDQYQSTEWSTGVGGRITLTGGRRYYIEVLYKEGGGADNGAATFTFLGDPVPQNGITALMGDAVGWFVDPGDSPGEVASDSDQDGLADVYELGQGRYEFVDGAFTWDEAKANAESRGGHLATITSEAEWASVRNLLGTVLRGRITWMGAHDREVPDRWQWVTGEPFGYSRWHPGEPNGSGSVAVIGWDSPEELLWDDYGGGDARLPYLLERGYFTDPQVADTDGDGVGDGEEISRGTNPLDGFAAPVIVQAPASQQVQEGAAVEFRVEATGRGLTFVWWHNGRRLNQTSSTLSLPTVGRSNGGIYRVEVYNQGGSVGSPPFQLQVDPVGPVPVPVVRPLSLLGWNRDLVMENSPDAFAMAFDHAGDGWKFYEVGYLGLSDGFPNSRVVISGLSPQVEFAFQPYNGLNALSLDGPQPGTLEFDVPVALSRLHILGASGSGGGVGSLELEFTDGSRSMKLPWLAIDWWANGIGGWTPEAFKEDILGFEGVGRVYPPNYYQGLLKGSSEQVVWQGYYSFGLYETQLDLGTLGFANKQIRRVHFQKAPTASMSSVMAVSGSPAGSPGVTSTRPLRIATQTYGPISGAFGSILDLSVAPSRLGGVSIRWFKDGVVLSDGPGISQTSSFQLRLAGLQSTSAGSYWAEITDGTTTVQSLPVRVEVTGLIAHYDFSNASDLGTPIKGRVLGNTGVQPTTDRLGRPGRAARFTGNTYLSGLADGLPTGSRTISFWARTDEPNAGLDILGYGGGGCGTSLIVLWNSCRGRGLSAQGHCDTGEAIFNPQNIDWTRWHQWTVVQSATMSFAFVDGTRVGEVNRAPQPVDVAGKFFGIGAIPSPGGQGPYTDPCVPSGWRGDLDEVRILDRALSDTEVAWLFQSDVAPASLGYSGGPQDQKVYLGEAAELAITAGPGVEFQWVKDGVPLPEDPRFDTSVAGRLRIDAVRAADQGTYSVRLIRGPDMFEVSAELKVQSRIEGTVIGVKSSEGPVLIRSIGVASGSGTPAGIIPTPMLHWDFAQIPGSSLDGELREGAALVNGSLRLIPGAYFQGPVLDRDIKEKTLEAWVSLDTLSQGGGGAITVETANGAVFDSIVYGERQPRKWIAGSDVFSRTVDLDGPEEDSTFGRWIHMVAVYSADNQITLYRNGKHYGEKYVTGSLVTYRAGDARVTLGRRHLGGGSPWLTGAIREAAIYSRALSAEEVGSLYSKGNSAFWSAESVVNPQDSEPGSRFSISVPAVGNVQLSAFADRNGDGQRQANEPQTLVPLKVDASAGPVSGLELKLVDPLVPVPDLAATHSADFESGVPEGWSANPRMARPGSQGGQMLGPLSNGSVRLSLANLPAHSRVQILFDLAILRSMDGDEPWGFRVDGAEVLRTSFGYPGASQFYPNSWGGPRVPGRTGQLEGDNDPWGYSFYRMGYLLPHSSSNLVVEFFAENQQGWNDEGWGLDNVRVVAIPDRPVSWVSVTSSASIREGDPLRLEGVAEGDGQLRFQWYRNGQAISGATARVYEVAAVSSGDFGSYEVEVQNHFSTARSQPIPVVRGFTRRTLPEGYLVNQPVIVSVRAEPPVGTTVYSVAETIPAGWTVGSISQGGVWDGTSGAVKFGPYLDGLTRDLVYTIQPPLGGTALAVWTGAASANAATSAVTGVDRIPAILAPAITAIDAAKTVNEGEILRVSITVSGTAPIQYQWYKDGVALAGGTNAQWTVSSKAGVNDAGLYEVSALNRAGQVVAGIPVTVIAKPRWVSLPGAKTRVSGQSLSLVAEVSGGAPLRYVWRQNGVVRTAFTGPVVEIAAVSPGDAGSWTLEVSNSAGSVVSGSIVVTVLEPPVVTTQPVDVVVLDGEGFELRAAASGTSPLSWEWRRNGQPIAGEVGPVLRRNKATVADEGTYAVTIRNAAGSATTGSAVVRVKVPFVTRSLPVGYWPGVKFVVRLRSEPRTGTQGHEITETVPTGWIVASVSSGGQVDAEGKTVRFGPFADAQARDLVYTLTAPTNLVLQTIGFSGSGRADGLTTEVRGSASVGRGPYHPADQAARDGRLGISEVTKYAASWKRGEMWTEGPTPIPVGYVTRAGVLWRQGEVYEFDPENGSAPRWWVVPPPRVRPADQTPSTPIRARRRVESLGGERWRITIALDPGMGSTAQALEEQTPAGTRWVGATEGGEWTGGVVRWGPYFDDRARELSYEVISGSRPEPGQGVAGVDGWMVRVVPAEAPAPLTVVLGVKEGALWLEAPVGAGRRLERSPDLRHWESAGLLPDTDQPIAITLPEAGSSSEYFRVIQPNP